MLKHQLWQLEQLPGTLRQSAYSIQRMIEALDVTSEQDSMEQLASFVGEISVLTAKAETLLLILKIRAAGQQP